MLQPNMDIQEINNFNQMAASWWDHNGPCKALHGLNPTRLQYITQQVSLAGKTILDVGCGAGILTESLAKAGATVIGIDAAEEVIAVAKQHASAENLQIEYLNVTVEDYLDQNTTTKFDVITCMELLEHVPQPDKLLLCLSKLLKDNGKLFLSTINRNALSYLLAIVAAEQILKLLPKNTHQYEKFITPVELKSWLGAAQLSLSDLSGISYNPLNNTSSLSDNIKVNFLATAYKEPDYGSNII